MTRAQLQAELGEGVPISWKCFKVVFFNHFLQQTLHENRACQFIDFMQGTMMVDQYVIRFIELSHFVSHLILEEEKKVEKFEHRLECKLGSKYVLIGSEISRSWLSKLPLLKKMFDN